MADTGKKKADKNKTIDFTLEEGQEYLERVLDFEKEYGDGTGHKTVEKINLDDLTDHTILGDSLKVLETIPDGSVDLLIVDPPYNLDKDFNGKKFRKKRDELYAEYTESWLLAVRPLLKKNASIYVCCDWESGMIIGPLIAKYFQIRNY